jgi:hypothetical protein
MKKEIKKWLQCEVWNMSYVVRSYCAVVMFWVGKEPACSTFIDEVSITAGYGRLNSIGAFRYDLPKRYVRKLFKGCDKWRDYLEKCA